jgi:adenosylhomocysteine nucleosidase
MKVLIAYAVEPEFDPWRKLRKFADVTVGDFTIRRTQIAGAIVDFVVSGMGPARASRAMDAVASAEYSGVIASGLAGALRAELGIGDIVIPQTVRRADEDSGSLVCDAALRSQGISAGAKRIETIVSSEHIATTVEEKIRLGKSAEAVDMESFSVMASAQRIKTPAVVIRAVSDRHDQAMPVDLSTTVDERGQVSIGGVMKLVAGKPGQISSLMKLGRESKLAAEMLARFLDTYIARLARAHLVPQG